jgi:actin-related protein 6
VSVSSFLDVYISIGHAQTDDARRQDPKANPIVQEYILPDFSTNRQGRIRYPEDIVAETDQILLMNNERFAVPEILFRPDDIGQSLSFHTLLLVSHWHHSGLSQSGLAATIAASVALLPEDLQGMFWANIGLIGGTTKFLGFHDRLSVHHLI